jgi:hypothetical protein
MVTRTEGSMNCSPGIGSRPKLRTEPKCNAWTLTLNTGPAETPAVLLGSWLARTSGRVALDPFEILIL